MLTRNFINMIGNTYGIGADNAPVATTLDGNTQNLQFTKSQSMSVFNDAWWGYGRFVIGSGTTSPKCTDINLESKIEEGYDCSILAKRYIQGEEKDYINIYGTLTNSGISPITFSELGWIGHCRGSLSSSTGYEFLLAREVYDTPITIAPGESVAVNVNIL